MKEVRTYKIMMYALILLSFVIGFIIVFFLPNQVPAHYGFDGQVTRWGSKWEEMIWPALSLLFGGLLHLVARFEMSQEKNGENNGRIVFLAGVLGVILFIILQVYFAWTSFSAATDLGEIPVDIWSLMFGYTGVLLIALGNVMPKCRLNGSVGVRTKWSMISEETWKQSQRRGGICSIATGVLLLAGNMLFFRGGIAAMYSTLVLRLVS